MSHPPMNSSFIESCGVIVQWSTVILLFLVSNVSSSKTLTPLKFTFKCFKTFETVIEKPHCGESGVPFLKANFILFLISNFILSLISIIFLLL